MAFISFVFSITFLIIVIPSSSLPDIDFEFFSETDPTDQTSTKSTASCPAATLSGVDWILHVRQKDYGWKENTHRAIIALAVSNWGSVVSEDRKLMEQQLEVEISKALLRNNTSPIYPNNLALYIHALIATNKNPRSFHGIDLVFHLSELIRKSATAPHPFLLLAMCNAKTPATQYQDVIEYYLVQHSFRKQDLEKKALYLQAYECAGTLGITINETIVLETKRMLAKQQYPDGSFGNVYTTALIVQALASTPRYIEWNRQAALDYLKEQSYVDVNIISTYLIQCALHAERVRFIKDLFPDLIVVPSPQKKHKHNFVQYSLRIGAHPEVHHTISINVPPNSNFFEIMKLCAENDPKYNFSYYMDKNNMPSIYAISGVPNDAEENMYWRLCYQTDVNHNRHSSNITTIVHSPILLVPQETDHVIYWYKDTDCEESS